MGENEDRGVERRVGTPRALPIRVLVPSGVPHLSAPMISAPTPGSNSRVNASSMPPLPPASPTAWRTSIGVADPRRDRNVRRRPDPRRCRSRRARWRCSGRGRVTCWCSFGGWVQSVLVPVCEAFDGSWILCADASKQSIYPTATGSTQWVFADRSPGHAAEADLVHLRPDEGRTVLTEWLHGARPPGRTQARAANGGVPASLPPSMTNVLSR